MAERAFLRNTKEADVERSTDAIRQDIARGGASITHTVEQLGECIKEKLDWREYVKGSPYLALGAAAGLGYLASRVLMPRTTPLERIMGSITEEVRDALGGLRDEAAGPGLIKVILIGIATKAAAGWLRKAASRAEASGDAGPLERRHNGAQTTG